MFGQTFSPEDLATISLLVVLEGILSIDNALVLGLLAARVEPQLRRRALSYGLIGAFVFRLIAVAAAAYLLHWSILKLLGGLYLIWIACKFFWKRAQTNREANHSPVDPPTPNESTGLWATIAAIELTDIAFAIDSILAAVALVGGPPPGTRAGAIHPKLWVIFTGGMLGVVLMRFAAAAFVRLLEKFPRLHFSAYLLVGLIGIKLFLDWAVNTRAHPDRLDFQSPTSSEFWIFWGSMTLCLVIGFLPKRNYCHKKE
jgi:YkoY family integral membrane protein